MKSLKNKTEGFTLVEVLTAVTLLGILSVIAVVSVNGIIQSAKKEHYETAEKQLKLAGQSYVQQNRSALPKVVGQKVKVPLKAIVERNYIEQITDYSGNNCDLNKSYVQIFKYSTSDYSYMAYLDCPAYNSKETITKGSPTISLTMSDSSKSNTASVNIKISDSEKLLSWSYIIYKDGKEVLNSGSNYLKEYPKSINKTINLTKYIPGKVKIFVTATNIYGLTTTRTSDTVNYKDTQGPTCIIKDVDKKTNPKAWTTEPVSITVGCDDGNGVGCTRAEFMKMFKRTTDVGTITISDKEGNKTTCEVSVNVDVTPPSVPTVNTYKWTNNSTRPTSSSGLSKYTENSWSRFNVFAKASGSTDSNSGFAKYQYTIQGDAPSATNRDGGSTSIETTGTSKIKFRACDNVGNCSAYSSAVTIKVDKVAPSCTSSGGSSSWTNGNRTLTGTCSDSHSGCDGNVTKKFSSDTNTTTASPGKVKDNAGNETNCPANQTVKIDKTAPSCTSSGGSSSWTNGNRTLTGTCSDSLSGCAGNVAKIYASNTNSSTESPGTVKDNAGNETTCPRNQTVKIDKTAPSCTSSGGNSNWTSGNRTLRGTCSDSLSGCVENITKTFSSDINTTTASPGTVRDNAGNQTACPANQTVKIDKTAPTAPTSGSIGSVSGSNTTGTIQTVASGSTDAGSGIKEYRYIVNTNGATPSRTSTSFTTSKNFTRSCGTTYYAYAIAIDNVGNRSTVKSLGHTSDGANSYNGWSSCSKSCGGGTQTRTNSCALVTTGLSQSCNTASCCSSTVVSSYNSWSSCSKKCGGGKQYRSANLVSAYDHSISCGTKANAQEQSCNTASCCSSTVVSSYSGWSSCSASCGGGKQYKSANLVSAYDSSISCGTQSNAQEQSCNTTPCCSESNPYGCNWVTSCREGATYIYTSSAADTYAGTVKHHLNGENDKLYVLGESGGLTKVYVETGNFYWSMPSDHIVWIYSNCIGGTNSVCPFEQCPSLGK